MAKLNYMVDSEFDTSPYEASPVHVLSDAEIKNEYPGIPILRRVISDAEKHERLMKNLRLMHAASKKKSRSRFYD